jgi:hypothetical protein
MVVLPQEPGLFLFHFWGTVWGELLTAVLITRGINAEMVNEYCLYSRQPITHLPPVDENGVKKAARDIIVVLANRLEMGRFHRLLPADVAQRAVLTQLNLAGFKQAYGDARLVSNKRINKQLHQLLSG